MTEKVRDPYFDNAKLLLIFLVIFGHLIQPFVEDYSQIEDLYYLIYTFHMPGFILISGYFSKNIRRPGYLRKTSETMLVPYVVFQFIYSLFYFMIQSSGKLSLQFLNPHWSLWFLLSMFFWNVALYLFDRFTPLMGMTVAIIIGLLAGYAPGIDQFLSLSRTMVFFPFFLLGFYLQASFFEKTKKPAMRVVGIILFVLLAKLVTYAEVWNKYWFFGSKPYDHFLENPEVGGVVRLFVYLISFIAIFAFFTLVPRKKYRFTYLGENTLYAYLLHGFIVKSLRSMDVGELTLKPWLFFLIVALSIAMTALFTRPIFKKSLDRMFSMVSNNLIKWKSKDKTRKKE